MASVLTGVVLSAKEHKSVILRDVRSDSDSESEASEADNTNVQNNVDTRKELECTFDDGERNADGHENVEGLPVTDAEGLRNLVSETLDMIGLPASCL